MQIVRRYRIPALLCGLAVLVCVLASQPYTNMGIDDDGPYILMARTFANTGHIIYNGWAAAMILAQLYLGAAFIKLFGYSFTVVRMSTVLVAIVLAWLLQRTLVRVNITERNATIGTLALVLSPLYLMISPTFMSDIMGLFAIVVCLYACLRALQTSSDRSAICWLIFAVISNVACGTSRQIAWLGTLVMVPCALWLLRARRRVLLAGAVACVLGDLFILACMHWFKLQPYSIPVPLLIHHFPLAHALAQLCYLLLDVPFFLLPVVAIFLPEMRRGRLTVRIILAILFLAYLLAGILVLHHHLTILTRYHDLAIRLEPTGGPGSWVQAHGIYMRVLLTIASLGGLCGFIAVMAGSHPAQPLLESTPGVSWKQLGFLFVPFAAAYMVLLLACAATTEYLFDRYALGLLPLILICVVRYYQERINLRLPLASVALVCIMAIYGISATHNNFSMDRARVALGDELRANGVPDTAIDGTWEYNFDVELQHASYINDPLIRVPANAYVAQRPLPPGICQMHFYVYTPHVRPVYTMSTDPNDCYGPAPFAPMHYSLWPFRSPGTLYAVRYLPPSKP